MALTKIITDGITDDAVTEAKLANAINTAVAANTAKDLTALSAANLTSGTIPDARFPATLPAASAANLTAVPAANITGTLPAISGANLTGIASAGKAHNLIINGAMQVAQRGTSSTTSGYGPIDRFEARMGNVGVTPTQSQSSLNSTDTGPWQEGFRNAMRIALPSAGTANSNAEIQIRHKVENQDMANSGWNYPSSSSYVTLSFWFRCSTNQTFYLYLYNSDSGKTLTLDFTASGNNTWTKITKQIKGASTLVFGDNNGEGLAISFFAYNGTAYTNNAALNTWQGYSGSNFSPDMATSWVTAGASTFDVTGVQLEVGDSATDFEHRSFGQELTLCQRYYQLLAPAVADAVICFGGFITNEFVGVANLVREMRIVPTLVVSNFTNAFRVYGSGGSNNPSTLLTDSVLNTTKAFFLRASFSTDVGRAHLRVLSGANNGGVFATIAVQAEL